MAEQVRVPEELGRALLEISRALLGAFGAFVDESEPCDTVKARQACVDFRREAERLEALGKSLSGGGQAVPGDRGERPA